MSDSAGAGDFQNHQSVGNPMQSLLAPSVGRCPKRTLRVRTRSAPPDSSTLKKRTYGAANLIDLA
uniref:Uncharacterized protein n=1 Tax=Anopheles minimus TaxID=112268 RepID=A0A182WNK1_9DIPT